MKRKISIIVPVFNRKELVGKAIESLLRQTVRDEMEIIIIDDGSTDGTAEMLEKYRGETVRIFFNDRNEGIVASRNRGIREARGAYIAMLDSDDYAYPDRLEKQRRFLEKDPRYGAVGSWLELVDTQGACLGISHLETDAAKIACELLFHNVVNGSAVMFRREAISLGGYDPAFPVAEEYRLFADMQQHGWLLANIPKPLTRYLMHDRKISFERRDTMEECTRRVIDGMLARLGIDYTEEEMTTHRALMMNRELFDSEMKLSDCGRWLARIVEANRHTRLLPQEALGSFVATLWFKVCCGSGVSHGKAYAIWRSSPVADASFLSAGNRVSFTIVRFVRIMAKAWKGA